MEQPPAAQTFCAQSERLPNVSGITITSPASRAQAGVTAGKDLGEPKADTLIAVIREAAANRGRVADHTWASAIRAAWTDQHLAEAFGYLGLAVFTSYFLNYADTGLDIPAAGAV